MLTEQDLQLIRASVPVLREHGEAITRCFYTRMFSRHPELRNVFNMGNQHSGIQQQSLASALYAYAANIDDLSALEPVIGRIVHKHVSLGVRAEHYPIVGENLLAAISETLGDAATPELIEAWGKAYGQLADALIDAERAMYGELGIEPGQFLVVKVTEKVRESATVTSFHLADPEGRALPPFKPGQYISVAVTIDALGLRQARQYSLSAPSSSDTWRISVKREDASDEQPAGTVSSFLHENVEVGDTLLVSPPCGDFVLDNSDEPLVLISAGVGVTPMMSMLHTTFERTPKRLIHFLHAATDGLHHHMKDELDEQARENAALTTWICYEFPRDEDREGPDYDVAGRLDIANAPIDMLPTNGRYYLCGPDGFMETQRNALLAHGISADRIECEVFGPALIGHLQ